MLETLLRQIADAHARASRVGDGQSQARLRAAYDHLEKVAPAHFEALASNMSLLPFQEPDATDDARMR